MERTIVILGKNYSTSLGVIRSLNKEGYITDLFYVTNQKNSSEIVASSKFVRKSTEQIGRIDKDIINSLISIYGDSSSNVLWPTDDYTSSLIDRNRDVLSKYFIMPYIDGNIQGAITNLMDKSVQCERAAEFGLNTAKSWTIDLSKDNIEIDSDISYPCFCKPIISARGFKSEICSCKSKKELQDVLKTLQSRRRDRSVMVQEFLNIDEEFSISGVCLGEEIFLPALLKKIHVAEFEKGVTLMGRVDNFDMIGEDILLKLKNMLASFKYTGMIDIELIRCGESIYFNELNFRSSGVSYAVTKAGCNLPAILAGHILGEDISHLSREVNYGMKFLYDKAAWEDCIHGFLTKEQLDQCISDSDFTMLRDDDDTLPMEKFLELMKKNERDIKINKIIPIKKIKRVLNRIKNK